MRVAAYQHGIFPRSEEVVSATRGLDRGRTSADEVAIQFKRDREDLIQAQQEAGLDFFSDGLLGWQDIFRPLVEACEGMEARTLVRWFNNNSFFRAPEISGPVKLGGELPSLLRPDADLPAPRVATLPSPYMFSRAAHATGNRNDLMVELATEVLAPVAGGLSRAGYEVIHLQEPWLVYYGIEDGDWAHLETALERMKESLGESRLVLHTYFGDAGPHADRLRALPIDVLGVDFLETDLDSLGRGWEIGLLAGCVNGRNSPLETVGDLKAFVDRVAATVDPPSLYLSSNCDLEFVPREVARAKVLRLGEVAGQLREASS